MNQAARSVWQQWGAAGGLVAAGAGAGAGAADAGAAGGQISRAASISGFTLKTALDLSKQPKILKDTCC